MLTRNWNAVGDAVSAAEQEALDALRALLDDDDMCHAWTNLQFPDSRGNLHEIDALLLTRKGLFVIELKGWHGKVIGRLNQWEVRQGDRHTDLRGNPVVPTNHKAKLLADLLNREAKDLSIRVHLPWVLPVVVLHGRGSVIELSDATNVDVYGLDGFNVKGVPHFSECVKHPRRAATLDKPTSDAIVRIIRQSGLGPRPRSAGPDATTDLLQGPPPVVAEPAGIFAELLDEQLATLGVPEPMWPRVKGVTDLTDLIGHVDDETWDDLEAVAAGEAVTDVIDRRHKARELLAAVDEQAHAAGWAPDTDAPEPDPGTLEETSEPAAPAEANELERQLREAFGDRVHSSNQRRERPKPKPSPQSTPVPGPGRTPAPPVVVAVEVLLELARTEALAGRTESAARLHRAVHAKLEVDLHVDWSAADLEVLAGTLADLHPLSERLHDLIHREPRTIDVEPSLSELIDERPGALVLREPQGPAYSLLIRVPDVLDRRSGLYLSQIIGVEAARTVNHRLRQGRPDGGRIRVTSDGVVVSRRDPSSPWFVVGRVEPHEWFPLALATAA